MMAEGFYDFQNNKYIYQYKDHLGNARLSYYKIPNGGLDIADQNDYYPFGMNHIRPEEVSYFGQGSYANYKYNSKELQETGMYDYGWRQYMPDIGRWNGIDQLASSYSSHSPYAYVMNNPVMSIDPDGRYTSPIQDLKDSMPNIYSGWENVKGVNFGDWHRFQSGAQFRAFVAYMAANGGGGGGGGSGGGSGGSIGGGSGSGGYSPLVFNDGLKEVLVPEIELKGKSSGWGSQMWNHFNNFMNQWNSNISSSLWWTNTAVGAASAYTVYKGQYHLNNELWRYQPYGKQKIITPWSKMKNGRNYWNNNLAKKARLGQLEKVKGIRNISSKLTKAGGVLLAADIVLSGEIKPSHIINGAMLGASTTGVGAIVAGAWFIADFGTMGANYLINGEAKGLGDMLDESVGTYEIYDGVY